MLWIYILGAVVVFVGLSVFFGAPYVPSHRRDIRRLFDELTPIGAGDTVLDIGSGDGISRVTNCRRPHRPLGRSAVPLAAHIQRARAGRRCAGLGRL